jgi:simple sugar transport system permease protein
VFNNHTPLVYFGLIMVLVVWVMLFKSPIGFNIRAVGEKPIAARTAGIKIATYQFGTLAWSGVMCGLGGAYLSTGSLGMFTEGMISGRGFMAFTAVVFGRGHPIWVMLASLLFGLADALSFKLMITGVALPTQLLQMFPYLLAVLAISLTSLLRRRRLGTMITLAD